MTQTLVAEPAAHSIPPLMGLARLAKMAFDGVNLAPLWQQLAARFNEDNADVAALMDICILDQFLNNADRGLVLQEQALSVCQLYQLPAKTLPARLKVLAFAVAGKISANTPIEFLIEDSDITLYLLYIVPGRPLPPLPEHDLAFVLAAESEQGLAVLQEVERLVMEWHCPVLNLPGLIPQVGRESLYKVLAPISGIEIPATICLDRAIWERVGREEIAIESLLPDGGFPLIARPRDSHAGRGLAKIDNPAKVLSYLSERPEAEFYVSRFVDYRSPDGQYRKYRVAVIEGTAFPSHLGISDHWMVHFLSAGMVEDGEKRREEQRFMDRFEDEFGLRHGRAIAEMAEVTGLDYFGIDCSETQDGKLLIFEADTALVVHNMDQQDIFPYKGPHMHAVFQAFRAMLYRKSEVSPGHLKSAKGHARPMANRTRIIQNVCG